mgnify:CR=1 FL=1
MARSEASVGRARAGGAAAVVPDQRSLPDVDGLVVATSTSVHAQAVEEALVRGVPVFVEKPLCDDAVAAERLASLGDGRLFVMDKWRYHPGVRELAAIVREERLGPVRGLRTVRVGWGRVHDDVDASWVLAPHDLSIALEVLGDVPEPRAAVADAAGSTVAGLDAILAAGDAWHVLSVSERSPAHRRVVALHCDEGVAVLGDGWDEHVTVIRPSRNGPHEERVATPGELPLLAELRAFDEHLRGGPPPATSARDGARIVAAISRLRTLAGVA